MIRKLAIALSLLGVCFTGFVQALGLGEANVKTALNQPLNAEIELVSTAGLSINEILPGLATREEFQKANVDRVYFLSDLRFEVKTNSQGKAIILLTSRKPVREPFLNFIVEVIWPSGRLLREYALLIDPPLFTDTPAMPASAPVISRTPIGDTLNVSSAAQNRTRSLTDTSNRIESGTYGPTTATDTLWDIAIKVRPDRSVSPQQVMLAIQDLNPNAFIDNNINKMKAGQVLRLPSPEQIKQRSQYQAIQLVIDQNEAHLGKRSPTVAQGSKSQSGPRKATSVNVLPSDELKLVVANDAKADSNTSASSGQSPSSGSDPALAITLEKLDQATIENKELSGRVGDLEEQLATLQRLLTLKNDQLASIQSQMRESELAKLQNESGADATELSGSDAQSSELIGGTELTERADVSPLASTDALVPDPADEGSTDTREAVTAEATPVATKTSEAPVQATRKPGSDNIIETIINNPLYLGIALISVLILVILLWLISRHNAKKEEEFHSHNERYAQTDKDDELSSLYDESDESVFGDQDGELSEHDGDAYNDADDDASDYNDDFEDESQDIIAEANAYIGYGRMDQAAAILEKAISADPVRTDYRLKLLAVYKDLGDRQAFERQFSELEAIQDSAALKQANKIREEMLDDELVALDSKENELNFDRAEQDLERRKNQQAFAIDSEQEAFENDLNEFELDTVSLEDDAQELDLTTDLDLKSLDDAFEPDFESESQDAAAEFSLDTDESEVKSKLKDHSDDFDDSILDVDLEDLDLNAELDQESEIELTDDGFDVSSDADDLVVSDDILEEAAQTYASDDENLDDGLGDENDFDFLSGTDEASTKLDLARAYIDMGDVDGAKDILLEVTKEGSETQQAEAKELLDSLD